MLRYGFLDSALTAASYSTGRFRVGAVVVGRFGINVANNVLKGHPELKRNGYPDHCGQHAEFRLCVLYPANIRGGTVYVARLNKNGKIKAARPCQYCERMLIKSRVKRVVYTTEVGAESMRLR